MADLYFYHEDDADDTDGAYGEPDATISPDEPPVSKLEKYADSGNIFNRQIVARTILETLRVVTDDAADVDAVLNVMNKLADDVEPNVRAELMEQVPHIAMYCQEFKSRLFHVVPQYLLPMVVKFLTDDNNQVRKTSQAALLVLLEQGLVDKLDVKDQVCPVIIKLTEEESRDDYRTEAVALLSKMAPLIGKEMSEEIFLDRFAALCLDPLFHVRKVCAANFGDFSTVVGSDATENVLLPKFFYLCEDGVWGVRKACADAFMPVSCVCSPAVRHSELSPLFVNLLRDESRWVKVAAFQALGHFISTFADSAITGLLHNDNGEIVITDPEALAQRLDELEEQRSRAAAEAALTPPAATAAAGAGDSPSSLASSPPPPPPSSSPSSSSGLAEQTSEENNSSGQPEENEDQAASLEADDQSKPSSTEDCPELISSTPPPPPTSSSSDPEAHEAVIDMDTSEPDPARESMLSSSSSENESDEQSPEEVRAAAYQAASDSNSSSSSSTANDDSGFNEFQFWRDPLPSIDLNEVTVGGSDSFSSSACPDDQTVVDCLTGGQQQVGPVRTSLHDDEDDMAIGSLHEDDDEDTTASPVKTSFQNMSTFDPYDNYKKTRPQVSPAASAGGAADSTVQQADPALPRGPPKTIQTIVPQLLVDHYVSMTDPSRVQTVDNEIAKHCAYSLPAVALTLGRSNWPLLKDTYEILARDMQWKVRRSLASSIHELGIILGEDAHQDLIPIFNGFLKDLDEVRIGLLKHLADFLKLLKEEDRREYLPRLNEFLKMDNDRNWRFRQEMAEQMGALVSLYTPEEVKDHLCPIAQLLVRDKVAAVRYSAVEAYTVILRHLLASDGNGSGALAKELMLELESSLLDRWVNRQTFACLCHRLFTAQVMTDEDFGEEILPMVVNLAWDVVPNVRITVARALYVIGLSPYFSNTEFSISERFQEAVSVLTDDQDPDVRAFFNPNQPPSNSEFYDSDGEPIGDVSSLPV